MSEIVLSGMHGFGDCLHERAILRQIMQRHSTVYLESSAVWPFHDLIAQGLRVFRRSRPVPLRTQEKNALREAAEFYSGALPLQAMRMLVAYSPSDVRALGSVLAAMCRATGCDYETADFSLPIPPAWLVRADALLAELKPRKPLMLVRPLIERPNDWTGCAARNPDFAAYAALYEAIADSFFTLSIADLAAGYEYLVGKTLRADAVFHKGELDFPLLAALFSRAALVFTSPGFAIVLAQAVGTPVAGVFGGYERGYSFSGGARTSPYLAIEPMHGCDCFRHDHTCQKEIDFPHARNKLLAFADLAARRAVAA